MSLEEKKPIYSEPDISGQSEYLKQVIKLTKDAALEPQVALQIELSINEILNRKYEPINLLWKCNNCGFELNDGKFCKNCGNKAQ